MDYTTKYYLTEIDGKYYKKNIFFIEVITELPIKYDEKTNRPYVECDMRNVKLIHNSAGEHVISIT